MFTKRLAAGIVIALSLGLALLLLSPAWMTGATRAPKPADTDETDFKGKVIVIRFNFFISVDPLALEGAKVRKLGDKYFLTGKVVAVPEGKDAFQDRTVWHALNEINQIIECDSADQAKKSLKSLPRGPGIPGLNPYGTPAMPEREPSADKK
jgi:hypothetical protein